MLRTIAATLVILLAASPSWAAPSPSDSNRDNRTPAVTTDRPDAAPKAQRNPAPLRRDLDRSRDTTTDMRFEHLEWQRGTAFLEDRRMDRWDDQR